MSLKICLPEKRWPWMNERISLDGPVFLSGKIGLYLDGSGESVSHHLFHLEHPICASSLLDDFSSNRNTTLQRSTHEL